MAIPKVSKKYRNSKKVACTWSILALVTIILLGTFFCRIYQKTSKMINNEQQFQNKQADCWKDSPELSEIKGDKIIVFKECGGETRKIREDNVGK